MWEKNAVVTYKYISAYPWQQQLRLLVFSFCRRFSWCSPVPYDRGVVAIIVCFCFLLWLTYQVFIAGAGTIRLDSEEVEERWYQMWLAPGSFVGRCSLRYCSLYCCCCLDIKPFFLPNIMIQQYTQQPSWLFILWKDTNDVVTDRLKNQSREWIKVGKLYEKYKLQQL